MKASEICVGSLVNYLDNPIEVLGIAPHCGDYAITIQSGWVYLKNCSPIPLTEEWLLKFGFELVNGVYWTKFRISFEEDDEKGYWNMTESFGGDLISFCVSIQYVHQLQNLYFALTNTELEIK